MILTCSGTGAMEATLCSLLKKKERVLTVNGGKFGERFGKISKALELQTDILDVKWGQAVTIKQIEAKLSAEHGALCLQASETSTGTYHPIQEISNWLQSKFPNCLLIVDGITAVGAMDIPVDGWKIDAMISGSQKAFMLPPGLAFVALSDKALERMQKSDLPKFYFDLKREYASTKDHQTAFTPSISLVIGLHQSLSLLLEEGLSQVYERHTRLASATRASLHALGLTLASESPSVTCTAAWLPEKIDGKAFLKKIKMNYGFTIAGGQDQWEGRVIRLSHLGYYTAFDLLSAITALGRQLEKEDFPAKTIEALRVFIETYEL